MELILASYIADLIFGDPQWFPHPVRLIGRLISFFHRKLSGSSHKGIERFWGALTSVCVVGISGICAYALIESAVRIHPFASKIVWVFLAYTTLATKDLAVHAKAVWKEVVKGNIEEARQKLSFIVGRDTQELSEKGVILATIETVAENTTDGIIAPLFYLFLGGPLLAVIFKAISTLDSMIGHKDEKYLHFGWCAARLDEVANYLPARITGVLMPLAVLIFGKDAKRAFQIMLKEGKNNSAVAEAAMAGALGVRLGGPCSYQGRIVEYPYLGEEKKPVSAHLIKEAISISVISSLLMVVIGIVVQQAFLCLVRL
jgi:adenosylcobinamide-phosphate synthase